MTALPKAHFIAIAAVSIVIGVGSFALLDVRMNIAAGSVAFVITVACIGAALDAATRFVLARRSNRER